MQVDHAPTLALPRWGRERALSPPNPLSHLTAGEGGVALGVEASYGVQRLYAIVRPSRVMGVGCGEAEGVEIVLSSLSRYTLPQSVINYLSLGQTSSATWRHCLPNRYSVTLAAGLRMTNNRRRL